MSRHADTPPATPEARRLFFVRKALGYEKQHDFAESFGILPNRYNPWEKGRRLPPLQPMMALQKKHGVPPEFIYEGVTDRLPHKLAKQLIKLGAIEDRPLPT